MVGTTAGLEVDWVGSAMGSIGTSSAALFFLTIRWLRLMCSARLTIGGARSIPWRAWVLGTALKERATAKRRVKKERRAIPGEY